MTRIYLRCKSIQKRRRAGLGCRFLWHFDSLGRGELSRGFIDWHILVKDSTRHMFCLTHWFFWQKYFIEFFCESIAELCTRIYGWFLYFRGLGIVQVQHKHESFSKSDYEFRQATGLVLTSLELQLAIITGCAAMRAPHFRPWLLPNNFLTKLDSLLGKIG